MTPQFPNAAARAILWSQWAYWCITAVAVWAYVTLPPGSTRTLLILAPILPGILIFGVTYWLYQACDEYIRFRVLKAATISAIIIAMFSLIYFFLELLGYPRLSMMWISLLGWSMFVAQMVRLKFERK